MKIILFGFLLMGSWAQAQVTAPSPSVVDLNQVLQRQREMGSAPKAAPATAMPSSANSATMPRSSVRNRLNIEFPEARNDEDLHRLGEGRAREIANDMRKSSSPTPCGMVIQTPNNVRCSMANRRTCEIIISSQCRVVTAFDNAICPTGTRPKQSINGLQLGFKYCVETGAPLQTAEPANPGGSSR